VQLDVPLPAELGVGGGTALFVAGWCFCREERIRALFFVVDGEPQPAAAHGMPRLDVFRALHPGLDPYAATGLATDPASADDPNLLGYRSGFWGVVRVPPRAGAAARELGLRAELAGGGVAEVALARLPVAPPPEPVQSARPEAPEGPLIAICMATCDPPQDLLERQLASIRAQTHRRWVCLISDDCSRPERFAAIEAAVGGDRRFVISRSPRRLGFYRNFERALGLVAPTVDHVALADQDDVWYPDKLATLLAELGGAQLAYSDARIVDRDGGVIAASYWERRHNNHADLLSLLVANAVTGAASCFRRDLLDDALPFPPAQFAHYHDHWLGLVALARGDIAYTERALYDYVQHREASLGHAAANRMTALRDRLGSLQRDPRERVRMWRLHYFADVARLTQVATVLELRCGDRMTARKRRALERFLRADRSAPALARLWARGARELVGRPETLGAEWMLAYAFTWRRLLSLSATARPARRLRLDAVPPSLAPRPVRAGPDGAARAVADKIAPLALAVRAGAPERVNVLIPTIDLQHLFGGYIAKLNLARRLAERGARVRIVTVDPVGPLPRAWARNVEAYSGLDGLFDRVELAFGRESSRVEVSPADAFVATTWWTAHVAQRALAALGRERFLYLIQEYEPFTFPMGSHAALAAESYRFPHAALFSSALLRDYFRRHGIGVYAAGPEAGDRASAAFENAITRVVPPDPGALAVRRERGLLFYARPEPHAARNMFELGVLGLGRALERGAFSGRWRLHGIGTVGAARRLELGGGTSLELLPRAGQTAYAKRLREHDVGLALMHTPHPSLVPIEMASAGMLTVTNTFENKTAQALEAISPNLIAAEPGVEAIADALCAAAVGAGDGERRVRGSRVRWSRDWDDSFDDALLDLVAGFLAP